ncbi:hypothetical protein EVAR_903_1 [Eumeta japonica]|uniref:Uncharacterized protein n=1 Tax=Eumeta variegata TaxID=151549 RepID=A0A4C1SGS6_EUMVA|nr:hypothetical protein EVAR_903_1 [Eumeta japonica]
MHGKRQAAMKLLLVDSSNRSEQETVKTTPGTFTASARNAPRRRVPIKRPRNKQQIKPNRREAPAQRPNVCRMARPRSATTYILCASYVFSAVRIVGDSDNYL